MNKQTTLFDPISNQIIRLLRVNGPMTAKELLKSNLDVSRATLYRKMEKMLSLEIVDVSETNIVRGQIEKKYCIKDFAPSEQNGNRERDELVMLNYNVSLTDEDYSQMIKDVMAVIDKYQMKNSKETKVRSLCFLSTPAEELENKD